MFHDEGQKTCYSATAAVPAATAGPCEIGPGGGQREHRDTSHRPVPGRPRRGGPTCDAGTRKENPSLPSQALKQSLRLSARSAGRCGDHGLRGHAGDS